MQHQMDFFSSKKRFKILVLHRRAGKSAAALNEQIIKTQVKMGIYYYVLPTYRQAKDVMWHNLIRKHVPMELVEKKNDSELTIYWKNGSIQKFVGCEDYDKHRGVDCVDVVFDEYSEMVEDVWTAIFRPILARNGGTATFCFTPKGKNHSWKLVNQARDDVDEWDVFVKTAIDTNVIPPKELESIRKTTPEALFNQEYMVDFIDNAGAFFRRVRQNIYQHDGSYDPRHSYQLGIDLAKYNDWTVITPFDLCTFKVHTQDRFNQVDWNLQKARIEVAARKYNDAQLKIDRTGVGDSIVEDLERQGLNIGEDGGVKFSQKSKNDLLINLATLLEQDKIKIPNDPGLIAELEGFQYEIDSSNGKLKFGTVKGMTDDRVMSLALAVHKVDKPLWSPERIKEDRRIHSNEEHFDKFSCF